MHYSRLLSGNIANLFKYWADLCQIYDLQHVFATASFWSFCCFAGYFMIKMQYEIITILIWCISALQWYVFSKNRDVLVLLAYYLGVKIFVGAYTA